ncbi:MAG TPA: hypothetical protein VGS21_11325, partial [Acidimicrobiales bacterium]|nr:hypothetical protein [Acidimicrobiales bacterium]
VGDSKSKAEHIAYGIPMGAADERRRSLDKVAKALIADGVPVWIGSGGERTKAVAEEAGAALNLWEAPAAAVAAAATTGEVNWGGELPSDTGQARLLLESLATAGATWAVIARPGPIDAVSTITTSYGGKEPV